MAGSIYLLRLNLLLVVMFVVFVVMFVKVSGSGCGGGGIRWNRRTSQNRECCECKQDIANQLHGRNLFTTQPSSLRAIRGLLVTQIF